MTSHRGAPREIEVLTFEGCPNAQAARALAGRIASEVGADAVVRYVDVSDVEAESLRFLGSPTIRVDGRDVEPGADARTDYAYACRLYLTERGASGLPDERWLRAALARSS